MSLKNDIRSIFKNKTGYAQPEHAIDQAESLKALSTDLYTDSKRFIYELLQNADDSKIPGKSVKVGVRIFDNYLVVAHTGKPFDKRDLRGICGVSDGTKKNLVEKTGYKGIGFKAVFGQSKCITIFTNGEYFRFDADYDFGWNFQWGENQIIWEQENDRLFLYPWQIIPIYTDEEEVKHEVKNFLEIGNWTVATIISLKKSQDVRLAIEQLSSNVNMFLFLKNIEELDFDIGIPKIITLHRGTKNKTVEIKRNGDKIVSWLLKSIALKVPPEIKSILKEERNIPDKLLNAEVTELTLAAKISNEGIQKLDSNERLLYSYLPTQENKYSIPVLVNSSFVIGANRETLHADSKWNQWLFKNIPGELLKWVSELVNSEFKNQAYELIPSRTNIENPLGIDYDNGLNHALKTIPFILSNQNELIKINQAVIDFTSISKKSIISKDVVRKFLIKKFDRKSIHDKPFLPYTDFAIFFKRIGVAYFEWDDVPQLLESKFFLKRLTPIKNIQFIRYCQELCNFEGQPNVNDSIVRNWPFILDHKGLLNPPSQVYFPTPDDKNWDTPDSEISFLHIEIQVWLQENTNIRTWLESLGVIEKTNLSYLRKTIIENASTYCTLENTLSTVHSIYSLYVKGDIGKEDLNQLSELKLLTEKGTLLPANSCYLSNVYDPRLELNSVLLDDIFVSHEYMKTKSEKEEWRRFFKLMGVKDGISLIKFGKFRRSELIENYQFIEDYFQLEDKNFTPAFTTFIADAYSNLVRPILLNNSNRYEFSKLFWSDFIQNTEIADIQIPATAFWGYKSKASRTTGSDVLNYLKWYIQNNCCIPTIMENCHNSTSVFINTEENIKIAGKYLPVYDGNELSPDWRSFFDFKTKFALSDYLILLNNITIDKNEKGRIKSENNERIQLIYQRLLDSTTNFSEKEITDINKWSLESSLPDKNGNPSLCNQLNFYLDGDASIFQGEFPFIYINATNRRHKELLIFLNLINVRVLRQSQFKLIHSPEKKLSDLKNRLKSIQPYLENWIKQASLDKYSDNISTLGARINSLELFGCDNLKITYGEEWEKTVQLHFDNEALYVSNPWNSNKVMISLPEQLCNYLNIRGYEKELDFLLRVENTHEIDEYFSSEGITLPRSTKIVSFQNIGESSNKISITQEFLASAGISTEEELKARLQDPSFNDFIHVSTPSFWKSEYVLNLIERAKTNIIGHLRTLEEYDCSDYDFVANSIIGGIKKNGSEIFIITRPSDNGEVIIFYPAEFDTLEYTDSELWYENGEDTPEKLTLGEILKVTGINKIPV